LCCVATWRERLATHVAGDHGVIAEKFVPD
jgi:hypothetical protein